MGKQNLTKKLLIKDNQKIIFLNQPDYFYDELLLSENMEIYDSISSDMDLVVLFVNNNSDFDKYILIVIGNIKKDGILWICYPKKSSGVETDASGETIRGKMFKYGYKAVTQISIDEIWTGIRFRKIELVYKYSSK